MIFKKIYNTTSWPDIIKTIKNNFNSLNNYLNIFYDISLNRIGTIYADVSTEYYIEANLLDISTLNSNNLTINSTTIQKDLRVEGLLKGYDTSTLYEKWADTWNGNITIPRDSSWAWEPSTYKFIDVNQPYYKIQNLPNTIYNLNSFHKSQQVGFIFDNSLGALIDPYRIHIGNGQIITVNDVSSSLQLLCTSADSSGSNATWGLYKLVKLPDVPTPPPPTPFDWGDTLIIDYDTITDGAFDSGSTYWTIFDIGGDYFGNSIAGGKFISDKWNYPYQGDNNGYMIQSLYYYDGNNYRDALIPGGAYKLSFNVTTIEYSAGSISFSFGYDYIGEQLIYTLSGNKNETIEVEFTANAGYSVLSLITSGSGLGYLYYIDNIKVEYKRTEAIDYWNGISTTGLINGIVSSSGYYPAYNSFWYDDFDTTVGSDIYVFTSVFKPHFDGSPSSLCYLGSWGNDPILRYDESGNIIDMNEDIVITNEEYTIGEYSFIGLQYTNGSVDLYFNGINKGNIPFYGDDFLYFEIFNNGLTHFYIRKNGTIEQIEEIWNNGDPLHYE